MEDDWKGALLNVKVATTILFAFKHGTYFMFMTLGTGMTGYENKTKN